MIKVECPVCQTGYTPERLGVPLAEEPALLTVACMVCKASFDCVITPNAPVVVEREVPLGWFAKTVLRRVPVVVTEEQAPEKSHTVATVARGE